MTTSTTPSATSLDYSYEHACMDGVIRHIAGVDEAGRGPLAGPVVAAAVILDPNNLPEGAMDSKKLSARKRDALFTTIMATAKVGIGQADVAEIDHLNIYHASLLAMARAIAALPMCPALALIDGNACPKELPCAARSIIRGDGHVLSIACASIIAKVTRDRLMTRLAAGFPHYGWERNAGYGTAAHMNGLASHGVCCHHRRSFGPVQRALAQSQQRAG